jgi:hypothetical protein
MAILAMSARDARPTMHGLEARATLPLATRHLPLATAFAPSFSMAGQNGNVGTSG